jgi:pilus assembly protein TadC
MVTTARMYADEEVLRIQETAREPLVSIEGVFLAFFLPPAIVAAVLVVASGLAVPLSPPVVGVAVGVALVPPATSMLQTLRRSERRNEILSELAKFQEHMRERSAE